MSAVCARMEEDWDLFALGALDEPAERAMAAHLRSGCAECLRRMAEARSSVASVSAAAPPRQPSANVEQELMRRVRGPQISRVAWQWPRWSFANLAPWAFAAACLLLAGWVYARQQGLNHELAIAKSAIDSSAATSPANPLPALASRPTPQNTEAQPASTSAQASTAPKEQNVRPIDTRPMDARQIKEDRARIADLETQLAHLQEENAAVSAATSAAEQRASTLETRLAATESRTEALNRDLDTARKNADTAKSWASEVAALKAQLAASRSELDHLTQVKARNAQIERLLQSASLQQVDLRAVDPAASRAQARVLYSPQGGLLLVASSLPKLDHEKCYQLWLIRKGAPAILSGGLLQISEDGRGFLFAAPTNDLAELTALAITDEPKGGSVSARGHKLLFGAQ